MNVGRSLTPAMSSHKAICQAPDCCPQPQIIRRLRQHASLIPSLRPRSTTTTNPYIGSPSHVHVRTSSYSTTATLFEWARLLLDRLRTISATGRDSLETSKRSESTPRPVTLVPLRTYRSMANAAEFALRLARVPRPLIPRPILVTRSASSTFRLSSIVNSFDTISHAIHETTATCSLCRASGTQALRTLATLWRFRKDGILDGDKVSPPLIRDCAEFSARICTRLWRYCTLPMCTRRPTSASSQFSRFPSTLALSCGQGPPRPGSPTDSCGARMHLVSSVC